MGSLPRRVQVHEVEVEPYLGDAGRGPRYGPAFRLRGFVEDTPRTVRASNGREVTAASTAYLVLDGDVHPEDRVTFRGRPRVVLQVKRHEYGGPTPNHQEVALE